MKTQKWVIRETLKQDGVTLNDILRYYGPEEMRYAAEVLLRKLTAAKKKAQRKAAGDDR